MKIKNFICLASFVGITNFCLGQGHESAQVHPDTCSAIPTLAELRVLVLSDALPAETSTVNVPTAHRAFFCRFDDKLDKQHIPLRMRLGSLEEVNRMESKPGYKIGQLPQ